MVLVTAVGGASGSKAAAAALACAGSDPDRPGLLIDVGGRPPRPTLIASAGARELEERLAAHLPQLRAASRGQTCHLAVPDDGDGRFESVRAALPLVRDSVAVVHLPPALLQERRWRNRSVAASANRCSVPISPPTVLSPRSPSATWSTAACGSRSSSGPSPGFRRAGRCSASCRRDAPGGLPYSPDRFPFGKRNFSGAPCYVISMTRKLTQRELRNNSGEVMRALDEGEDFIVTRNGKPVGELRPYKPRQFIPETSSSSLRGRAAHRLRGVPGRHRPLRRSGSYAPWLKPPRAGPDRYVGGDRSRRGRSRDASGRGSRSRR